MANSDTRPKTTRRSTPQLGIGRGSRHAAVLQALGFAALATLGALAMSALALTAGTASAASPETGRQVFEAQKCSLCHGVEALGIEAKTKSEKLRGKDLSNIGAERDAEWLGKFLRHEQELDGAMHKKEFKGTDEELQALLEWLGTMRKAEGAS